MDKNETIYQTTEIIYGCEARSKIWYEYEANIHITKSEKTPIIIKLKFLDNHPFVEIPKNKMITGETITEAFIKLTKYLKKYGLELKI